MSDLTRIIAEHRDELFLALLALVLILAVALVALLTRVGRLTRLYQRLTRNTSGGNLEDILRGYMDSVDQLSNRSDALDSRLTAVEAAQKRCLQRVGLVRFDAFDDVGGEQSFAVVLLDAEQTGVTLSSVYSRSDVRVYAKSIEGGSPSHPLTNEERAALERADGNRQNGRR